MNTIFRSCIYRNGMQHVPVTRSILRCCSSKREGVPPVPTGRGPIIVTSSLKDSELIREEQNVDGKYMFKQVKGLGDSSFMINDVYVGQSVLLLPKSFFLWNAKKFEDVTVDSLTLFSMLYPTIEVLFIGCGERQPGPGSADIIKHFKNKGIVVEFSDTANAASTFNVLVGEGRNVGAALLTNKPASEEIYIENEMMRKRS